MNSLIGPEEIDKWNQYVLECYPNEACAIVVEGKVIFMDNVAEDPAHTFTIDPVQYWQHKDKMEAILHSHICSIDSPEVIDPRIPSKADMIAQHNTGLWWGISATEGESVSAILWFGKDRGEPYEGREFIYNVNDCLELARDYYRRELGYEIPAEPRFWDWYETENLFEEKFSEKGFVEVPRSEIQKDDLVLFSIGHRKINHIGIYLGDDKVLHHLVRRLSFSETLSKWDRQITKVLRLAEKV